MIFHIASFYIAITAIFCDDLSIVRGLDIKNQAFYNPNQDFTCLDGSMKIPFSSVNDDYCDCVDGSDEPGTSACPNGRYHCLNLGHKPFDLQSSRVNDGICDCCDGSDEYDSDVACFNECDKYGREEVLRLQKEKEEQEAGVEIRRNYIKTGEERKEEKKMRAETLNQLLEERRLKLEELKSAKETAEAPEKEAKDKHEKAWEEIKAKKEAEKVQKEREEAFSLLDIDKNGWIVLAELLVHPNLKTDISEEEAKELLNGEALVDREGFTAVWEKFKSKFVKEGRSQTGQDGGVVEGEGEGEGDGEGDGPKEGDLPEPATGTDDNPTSDSNTNTNTPSKLTQKIPPEILKDLEGLPDDERARLEAEYTNLYGDMNKKDGDYDDDDDDDDSGDDDDDDDDEVQSGVGDHRLSKANAEDSMPDYDEETKRLMEAADQARKAHSDAESELREFESEQRAIDDYMKIDFGKESEFAALKGECFEFTDREYVYKLCPFDRVTQKPKSGGSETDLGRWGTWVNQDDYSQMKYEGGQTCWNGPARSTKILMSCGRENTLNSVVEPSRCEYEMEFKTPALCVGPDHQSFHTEL